MTRLAWFAALGFAVLLAFALRVELRGADLHARGALYAGLGDAESAYRLRLVELVLATGEAPRRDNFLEPSGSREVPWPPLVHSALGTLAARLLPGEPSAVELNGYREADLERFALRVGPLLGACAALAAALFGAALVERQLRERGAALAALAYALFPLAIARESAGSLHAHPWIAALGFVQLAFFAIALRAAERVDVTIGSLVCGLCAGLAQLAGPEAWPLSASILTVMAALALRRPRAERRDAWRPVMLYLASALAVFVLPDPGDAAARLLPDFSRGADGWPACSPGSVGVLLAALLLGGSAAWRGRSDPVRAALLGAAFTSLACALFDRRFFAPLSVSVIGLCVAGASGAWLHARPARLRIGSALGGALLLASAAAWWGTRAAAELPQEALPSALRWLRERSSSPGAFNHPDAQQAWRVAAPPALAGSVALHARRGVLAATFEGHATDSLPALRELLGASDSAALAAALARADCPYLLLTPRMLRDSELSLAPDGLIARLALGGAEAEALAAGELERVYASSRWETPAGRSPRADEPCGPAVSVYRRTTGRSGAPAGAQASPGGR